MKAATLAATASAKGHVAARNHQVDKFVEQVAKASTASEGMLHRQGAIADDALVHDETAQHIMFALAGYVHWAFLHGTAVINHDGSPLAA